MISFRTVEDKDYQFIETLYRSTREPELSATNWSEDQKQQFVIMQSVAQLDEYNRRFPGAEHKIILFNKKLVGRLFIWESAESIRIVDISLLSEFRNKGIGGKVVADIIQLATQKRKTVTLSVLQNNPAKRFYERLGFKTVGTDSTRDQMEYRSI